VNAWQRQRVRELIDLARRRRLAVRRCEFCDAEFAPRSFEDRRKYCRGVCRKAAERLNRAFV
jgi:hypothetical protein